MTLQRDKSDEDAPSLRPHLTHFIWLDSVDPLASWLPEVEREARLAFPSAQVIW